MVELLELPAELKVKIIRFVFDAMDFQKDREQLILGAGVYLLRPSHRAVLQTSRHLRNISLDLYHSATETLLQDQQYPTKGPKYGIKPHALVPRIKILSEHAARLDFIRSVPECFSNIKHIVWTVCPYRNWRQMEWIITRKMELDDIESKPFDVVRLASAEFDQIAATCRSLKTQIPALTVKMEIVVMCEEIQCPQDLKVKHQGRMKYQYNPNEVDPPRLVCYSVYKSTTGDAKCEACAVTISDQDTARV